MDKQELLCRSAQPVLMEKSMTEIKVPVWVSKRAEWTTQIAFEALCTAVRRDVDDANSLPTELTDGAVFHLSRAAVRGLEFVVVRKDADGQDVAKVTFRRKGNSILVGNNLLLYPKWDYSSRSGKFVSEGEPYELGQICFMALESLFFHED